MSILNRYAYLGSRSVEDACHSYDIQLAFISQPSSSTSKLLSLLYRAAIATDTEGEIYRGPG